MLTRCFDILYFNLPYYIIIIITISYFVTYCRYRPFVFIRSCKNKSTENVKNQTTILTQRLRGRFTFVVVNGFSINSNRVKEAFHGPRGDTRLDVRVREVNVIEKAHDWTIQGPVKIILLKRTRDYIIDEDFEKISILVFSILLF